MKTNKTKNELSLGLKKIAVQQGFNPVGIAEIPGSERMKLRTAALERWIQNGNQADMDWMSSSKRQNIENLLEGVKSVLAVGLNYHIEVEKKPGSLSIARYAWGNDYHNVVKKKLKHVAAWLVTQRPRSKCKICVDTTPLLDKAWAEEAGIGWIGKNSNLINPTRGSWMVLGHLLSTEELTPDKPGKSLCGKCQACLEACPTNAITEPFVVDSNRCLAYHTIENRNKSLPLEIRKSMGTWIAGCDICQEVCPWNQKGVPNSNDPEVLPKEWILELTKSQAIEWDDAVWAEKLKGSALKRIKPWMWRRNAKSITSK